ncbi:endolytic transglycosylase MltG [Motiliproteus sediminis]|uniref:endolytic transglycosylase MltG n=1 Tax=Motiliproteus sediminis TaxID=1468178 RepID=UPI001AF00D29|nr:endolytic transglycosylase MltG [Motiliproteus sediminis]
MRKLLLISTLLLAAITVVAVIAVTTVKGFGDRALPLTEPLVFEVPRGSSFRSVVEGLAGQGAVKETLLFRLYARNRDAASRIHAGEYQIRPGMTHGELLDAMTTGKVIYHQLTFVEGLRVQDYLAALQSHEAVDFDLADASPEGVARLLGLDGSNPEGWIYPDTYQFSRGTAATQLLRGAYERMKAVLGDEWATRQQGLPLDTPYDALILASIVEKETGVAEERPAIAGVFVRRLLKGMRLQTDPTVIYGMGEAYQGRIGRADLRRPTPYNTYVIRGLPPTPIASPARAAIHAALNPAEGDALYFVAKGDGSHQFSATLRAHNRAVERYQRSGRRSDYRSAPPPAENTGS